MRWNRCGVRRVTAVAWAVGLLGLLPSLAEAQLFPNATIKRQRVHCSEEPSVYGLYRQQYYGYYPTGWRRFPGGWGFPSTEAPNSAAALEEIRRDLAREGAPENGEAEQPAPEPGAGNQPAAPGGNQPAPRGPIPLPGDERSPFEMPEPATPPAPTAPETLPSPFDDLPPPNAAPAPGPGPNADLPPALDVPPPMVGETVRNSVPEPAPRRSMLGSALASARDRLRR